MDLPEVVLIEVFKYLKKVNLIYSSVVCKMWTAIIWNNVFSARFRETNRLFFDGEWLMNTYAKIFDRFRDDVYWEYVSKLTKKSYRFH